MAGESFLSDFPVLLTATEASALLEDAADVHPTGVRPMAGTFGENQKGIIIEMDAGVTPVTLLHVDEGIRLGTWDFEVLSNLRRERRQHQLSNRDKVGADVAMLRAHRLPLYWNHEWRAEKLRETGSFPALAEKYKREVQGSKGTSIYHFDRKFIDGIRVQEAVSMRRANRRDEFAGYYEENRGALTQTAMAKDFGVTNSTISRWIRELTRIYRQLTADPGQARDDAHLQAFAQQHKIDAEVVRRWVAEGSTVFLEEPASQPKENYYNRDEYERLFLKFAELYRQKNGDVNQSAAARDFNVNRGTIRQWLARIDQVKYRTKTG